jgi:hypothetical protein
MEKMERTLLAPGKMKPGLTMAAMLGTVILKEALHLLHLALAYKVRIAEAVH